MTQDDTGKAERQGPYGLPWSNVISLGTSLVALILSLTLHFGALPTGAAVALVGSIMLLVVVLAVMVIGPSLQRVCRQTAARWRAGHVLLRQVRPLLEEAQDILSSRLLKHGYQYSWAHVSGRRVRGTAVEGPQVPDKCRGMEAVLEQWLSVHIGLWRGRASRRGATEADTVKQAVNELSWIAHTLEAMIRASGLPGGGEEKQAWEQFRSAYNEFIGKVEQASKLAAGAVEGTMQHRFYRLPG